MISQRAIDAVEQSDTDDLLRVIDGYCESNSWENLLEMRTRCQEALTRGKQLWGVDEHIRYRLALEAPPEYAGPVVSEGAARFALGPLPEVAASTKSWSQLENYLELGPERQTVAAERVVRGEAEVGPIADLPAYLLEWEPAYPVATYKSDKVEAPSPNPPKAELVVLPDTITIINDFDTQGALADLVQPWTSESNGRCETATVEGDAAHAVRALGLSNARMVEIDAKDALSWMAWAGASGGAHGRRRGAAAGRYGAWWAIAMIGDLEWPPDSEEIGELANRLKWFWFDDGAAGTGWELRLAIEDPESGMAWVVTAVDAAD